MKLWTSNNREKTSICKKSIQQYGQDCYCRNISIHSTQYVINREKICAEKRFDPIYSRNNTLISGSSTTSAGEYVVQLVIVPYIAGYNNVFMRKSLFWSN